MPTPFITTMYLAPMVIRLLNTYTRPIVIKEDQDFLARLRVDASLRVGREPGVQAGAGNENVARLPYDEAPRLITAVEFAGRT